MDKPCRCAEVFAAYDAQLKSIESVEAHQGVMNRAGRGALAATVTQDLLNHKLGRCYR